MRKTVYAPLPASRRSSVLPGALSTYQRETAFRENCQAGKSVIGAVALSFEGLSEGGLSHHIIIQCPRCLTVSQSATRVRYRDAIRPIHCHTPQTSLFTKNENCIMYRLLQGNNFNLTSRLASTTRRITSHEYGGQ
jgi:hypothetical protein